MASILSEEVLQNASVEELKHVCEVRGIQSNSSDKGELIQTIMQTLGPQAKQIEQYFGTPNSEEKMERSENLYLQEGAVARQFRPDRTLGETIYEEDIRRQQAEQSSSMFQYRPLESGNSIRIVILLPGKEDEKIECISRHTDLDKPLGYLGLSYTWGDSNITVPIILDGHEVQVTENLESALRHLRAPTMAVGYWIDALCINQKDVAERNNQVQLMKNIYEKSNGVVAWLGPEGQDSNLALEKMMEIQSYKEEGFDVHRIMNLSITSGRGLDEPWYAEPWAALWLLFRRDWWYRVWVAQEASTNRTSERIETRIVCGKRYATWTAVMATVNLISVIMSQPGMEWCATIGTAAPSRLDLLKEQREKGEKLEFLEVLNILHALSATDLRDKVYAGLGMATDLEPRGFRVDYSLPVHEVYTDVPRYFLARRRDLEWLGLCHLRDGEATLTGLPSWVPDWTHTDFVANPMPKFMQDEAGNTTFVYNACGSEVNPDLTSEPLGTIDSGKLILKGFQVGSIISVLESSASEGEEPAKGIQNTSIEKSWAPSNPEDLYLPTNETMEAAYLRIIVGDVKTKGKKAISRGFAMDWSALDSFEVSDYLSATKKLIEYLGPLKIMTSHRRFAMSDTGYMGLVPRRAQVGDSVYILKGGHVPYVLRENGETYTFIGECYVHGLMDDEGMKLLEKGEFQMETVVLV
jgi:hypothetical protein